MEYFVGIDVGTSGCKVAIFDAELEPQAFATEKYTITTPRPGWAEFDPDEMWDSVCEAVRSSLEMLRVEPSDHSFSLSFSVFGDGLITTNADGDLLHPGLLSADLRSAGIATRMENELGRKALFDKTGRTPHTMAVATKIVWLRENRPDLISANTRFIDMQAWLLAKLGTGLITDYSHASGTMLFDIDDKVWTPDLLAYAGISPENLPASVQAGTPLGSPNDDAARELGFSEAGNLQVTVGAMDQMCNSLGSGTVRAGDLVCSMGTVECVTVVMAAGARSEALIDFNMPRVPSAIADQFSTHILLWDGGRSLGWFCDNFAQKQKKEAERHGSSVFSSILSQQPQTSSAFFLPHLSGSGTPWQNPMSRGAFLGLTTALDVVSAGHAIIEGVTFELKVNLDNLASLGVSTDDLKVVGGGSKSDTWLQLKADVLDMKVTRPAYGEAGCMGAALLAAYGAGLVDDLAAASKSSVTIADTFLPSDRVAHYQKKFDIYREIYGTLEGINREISLLDG